MKHFISILLLSLPIFGSAQLTYDTWFEQELKDEFGDPSGSMASVYITEGTFSNSATMGSELTVRVVDYGNAIFITLFEYGRTPSNFCYEGCIGKIGVKASNGAVNRYQVYSASDGDIVIRQEDSLYDIIKSGEELKFVIEEDAFSDYGSAKYRFTIQ
jgi:hypothetical protein